MAIAFDAVSSRQAAEAGSTATWSHTCSGSDRVLIVATKNGNNKTVSGVTYNGVAMTEACVAYNSTDNIRTYLFYLADPDTGAHDIVVTFSSSGAEHGSGGVSFTGANPSSPIGATNTSTGSSSSPSTNITTLYDNSIVIDLIGQNSSGGTGRSAGADQTERWGFNSLNPGNTASSTEPTTTKGSVTMSWSMGINAQFAHAIVEVREFIEQPPNPSVSDTVTAGDAISMVTANLLGVANPQIQGVKIINN